MPRFNTTPPDGDTRRELQERAREAAKPAGAASKARWPFPIDTDEKRSAGDGDHERGGDKNV